MRIIFLLFFICLFFNSCTKNGGNCIKSPGSEKSISENLGNFNSIILNDLFDVTIIDSTSYSIKITTGEYLLSFIKYEIIDNELIIDNSYKCSWLTKPEKPKITISTPTLEKIIVNDACDLRSIGTLNYNNLIIDCFAKILTTDITIDCDDYFCFKANSTTGDYYIKGRCGYAFLYNLGHGYLYADDLKCEYMDFVHESHGHSRICATNKLSVSSIKYGEVFLITNICPEIVFANDSERERISGNCI
ncbi:MAG: DUF2807 domain-containing protein [Bacteroidales bacterium]|jgi:hypothetical protein|nr:DUF2807 domain-containing protein [Bacteroidales bacterium]